MFYSSNKHASNRKFIVIYRERDIDSLMDSNLLIEIPQPQVTYMLYYYPIKSQIT